MKTLQIYTSYENYKGGINNLQVSKIVDGYSIIKIFTSQKDLAKTKAEKYLFSLSN